MKPLFWFLKVVAFALLGVTVNETWKLRSAQAQLDRNIAQNAHVQSTLLKLQRQQLATAQLRQGEVR